VGKRWSDECRERKEKKAERKGRVRERRRQQRAKSRKNDDEVKKERKRFEVKKKGYIKRGRLGPCMKVWKKSKKANERDETMSEGGR